MFKQSGPRQFTGGHMIAAMLAFFGVIISVNLLMATFATKSWTGLVVKNSYVASQTFNESAEAFRRQEALGWHGEFAFQNDAISYRLIARDGTEVTAQTVALTFRRPAHETEDHSVMLTRFGDGDFRADHPLGDGAWVVEVAADTGLDLLWRKSFRISVEDGRLVQ